MYSIHLSQHAWGKELLALARTCNDSPTAPWLLSGAEVPLRRHALIN